MKNTLLRRFLPLALSILCSTVLIMGVSIAMYGMYPPGIPAIEQITRVEISCPARTGSVNAITDAKQIERVMKLTGFLRYVPFRQAEMPSDDAMKLTFRLEDGITQYLYVDETSVLWRGKAYALKEEGAFVKLVQGLFFDQDAQR
ncbi:MAG: hypothetical protein ACI4XW_00850 [Candidatus Spyradocola sp.]